MLNYSCLQSSATNRQSSVYSTEGRETLLKTDDWRLKTDFVSGSNVNQMLSENTGQPLDVIAKDTDRDNFMSAEEAKAYGLIDKVIAHK